MSEFHLVSPASENQLSEFHLDQASDMCRKFIYNIFKRKTTVLSELCIDGEYKMWYCGSRNKKNGVEIILKKEHVEKVVELWRVTDRIICLKMELDGVVLNVISMYTSQVGCICEKRKYFGWT